MTSALEAGMSPWAGGLPNGWRTSRLKWVTQLINQKTELTDRPYLGLENVESGTGRWLPSRSEAEPEGLANLFEQCDVLFGKLRPYLAKVYMAEWPGRCTSEMLVLRPHEVLPEFLRFVLLADETIKLVDSSTYGAKMPRAEWDFVGRLVVPVPEKNRQRRIAAFLDRKTAAIDDLIAKKERLVELLQEKRQVLITQAVTKGLDPKVPMKHSGIEWLGEIPATWTARPLSHTLAFISYGFTNPMPTEDDGPHMLTANDIGDGIVKYESARRTAESEFRKLTSKSRPVAGDILVTKDGTLGRVAVAGPQKACINQSVAILRTSGRLGTSEFIQLALRAGPYQERMLFEAGGTTIKHIYITRLAKMPIAFPPLEDQPPLCRYMAGLNERTAERIQAVGRSIEQLREYRQALISAAVTGKIEIPAEEAA